MLITVGTLGVIFGVLLGWIISNIRSQKELTLLKVENAKLQNITDIKESVLSDFTSLANQALLENQKKLDEQSKAALEDKLKPLSETILRYQKQIEDFNKENMRDAASLKTQIEGLTKTSQGINEETQRLTRALTQNQNVKGSFGEGALEVVLQTSGMVEGVHYTKHFSTFSENVLGENKRVYPDYVINLPEGRHIVVDSKMNLESFIKYQNEEEDTEKERSLKEFKTDIKNTIKSLADKNYQNAQGLSSPDFVLMYIPLEGSLALLYQDDELLNFASSRNIVLIGTASLITTVKLVKNILAQERQRDGHLEIAKCGKLLYNKFVDFCTNLELLQKKFKDVDKEFVTTINRFKRGEDSLFKTSKKLEELGIESAKKIPEQFLEEEPEEVDMLIPASISIGCGD